MLCIVGLHVLHYSIPIIQLNMMGSGGFDHVPHLVGTSNKSENSLLCCAGLVVDTFILCTLLDCVLELGNWKPGAGRRHIEFPSRLVVVVVVVVCLIFFRGPPLAAAAAAVIIRFHLHKASADSLFLFLSQKESRDERASRVEQVSWIESIGLLPLHCAGPVESE